MDSDLREGNLLSGLSGFGNGPVPHLLCAWVQADPRTTAEQDRMGVEGCDQVSSACRLESAMDVAFRAVFSVTRAHCIIISSTME